MSLPSDASLLRSAVISAAGPSRTRCEDAVHVDAAGQFFIVADGLGGRASGEVASHMAVQIVRDALEAARPRIAALADDPGDEARRALVAVIDAAVRAAHRAVYVRGSIEADKQGMVSNLDVLVFAGREAIVAHVGDTRTYLIRGGEAALITTDHTLAEVMVLEGSLSSRDARCSPLRTVVVNAVGAGLHDVIVEITSVPLWPGDRLLLSTDGLHDAFSDERAMAEQLGHAEPAEALVQAVAWARSHGGCDDITGVLVEVAAGAVTDSTWIAEDTAIWDAMVVEVRDHAW